MNICRIFKKPTWIAIIISIISLLISVGSFVVSICAIKESYREHTEKIQIDETHRKEDEQKKKAMLTSRGQSYEPSGNSIPTVVSFFNEGQQEALIERVGFKITSIIRTPKRENLVGQGPTIPIYFSRKHYDKAANMFSLVLHGPSPAPGSEWTSLNVAIIDPQEVGKTYIGEVKVYYDTNKIISAKNVEVDVLREIPVSAPK
jgi:hypothetical protein